MTTSATGVPWNFTLSNGNVAETMEVCEEMLRKRGIPLIPENDGRVWCNATYDTILCWPPTPANSSVTLQCPQLKGLDPTKNITKQCHASGRWLGRSENETEMGIGWTNFSMCYTEEVIYIMNNLNNESLAIAQEVARNARKLEFVGLGLSFVSLCIAISIFSYFRRLRVFRNLLHLHLMIAMLMVVIIRLVLYIDLIFTGDHGPLVNPSDGKTINTMPFVCEGMFFLLEYFKTVTFCWMFLEGIYLNNHIIFGVFSSEPSLTPYCLAGYGIPLVHTLLWLMVVLIKKDFKVERCLGSYYLEPEFWILDGPRMAELVINSFFLINVIRVLYFKVRETSGGSTAEAALIKSVKAAFMLIPLLGVPNIMQTIPFAPTRDNIMFFAIWTYTASFTYMYQGLIVSSIYCFINREVNQVLKAFYARYRLLHKSQTEIRRGSRSVASHYQAKNGNATCMATNTDETGKLSPYSGRHKKGSNDSTTKLVIKDTPIDESNRANNNNKYGTASEFVPLKNGENCPNEMFGRVDDGAQSPASAMKAQGSEISFYPPKKVPKGTEICHDGLPFGAFYKYQRVEKWQNSHGASTAAANMSVKDIVYDAVVKAMVSDAPKGIICPISADEIMCPFPDFPEIAVKDLILKEQKVTSDYRKFYMETTVQPDAALRDHVYSCGFKRMKALKFVYTAMVEDGIDQLIPEEEIKKLDNLLDDGADNGGSGDALREEHVTLNKQLAAVLASATSEPTVTIGGLGSLGLP
ncbi:unnamed protein product [Caenorhabditis bovis]|uniref:Calcitonin receptor n=1 Tax=Caenorhabditis bovis TaxID=2654633 RepID=A0A8S1EZW7_9PELO|nr:unnamed protein product [Caenorhabditis bovis]